MKHLLLFFTALSISAAHAQVSTNKVIDVAADKSFQNYEHFNRLVLDSKNSSAEFIEGFEFEWGYEYKLLVEEIDLVQTLSDGTQYDYKLIEVKSKVKANDSTEFRLFIDPEIYHHQEEGLDSQSLKKIDDHTYRYLDSVNIQVPEELLPKFKKLLESPNGKVGFFNFLDGDTIRLIRI